MGGSVESRRATMIAIESPISPWPAMNRNPYIVEYQCGSSDITQSIDASVIVTA